MTAGARDFTTLAALKAWIPVAGNADDDVLQRLITNISSWMENELSRNIYVTTVDEIRNGTGTDRLMLTEFPTVAVTSLEINGTAVPLSAAWNMPGYVVSDFSIVLRGGLRFTRGVQNVHVVYTAGYADDPDSVPLELQQSCLELCHLRYKERPFVGVQSKSLGGETITFSDKDMPKSVAVTMDNYRKRLPL